MERRVSHFATSEIEFAASDRTILAGTLTLPPGMARPPVVIAVHAARAGTRDAPLHQHLASFLPALGIASFIYDRRGEGASGGCPYAPLPVLADDARAAISAVARQPQVRTDGVGLWGHSQGGWIAPLAAAGNGQVAFLVVVAGSGVSPHEQMIFATASLMREAGYDEQEVAQATSLRIRLHKLWRKDGGSPGQTRALMREASSQPWYGLTYLGDPGQADDQTLEATFGWDLDIRPAVSQLQVPVLLFYGETDRWVPIEPSIAVWQAALNHECAPLSVSRLPGCGHFPTLPADPADLDEAGPVSPLYERVLAGWLTAVAPPARP